MDHATAFRKALLRRLLDIVGVAAIASCGGKVIFDDDGASGGQGGAGHGGGADAGSCVLTETSTGSGLMQKTECFSMPGDACPTSYDAAMHITPVGCAYLVSVDCGPILEDAICCYLVTEQPHPCEAGGTGRPFFVGDDARTASPVDRDRGWCDGEGAPMVADLDEEDRAALAADWTTAALEEHASIASFSRLSMALMAAGAPADLIAQAHRAALDEVRHARLCFALAEGYRGAPIAPSRFPFEGRIEVDADLAALAVSAAREGCIGETLAALLAAEQLTRAEDPAVRRALAVIADDEARHAELAFRTIAWAIQEGGEAVREAAREVFGNAARHLSFERRAATGISPGVAAAHGRLDAEAMRKAVVRALAEVILPCGNALLSCGDDEDSYSLASTPRLLSVAREEAAPETQRSPC